MLTIYLQRVRSPDGMNLKEYTSFYSKLLKKYGSSTNLKIGTHNGYYSNGGYWLIERRLETDGELAKRQATLDKRMAVRKAQVESRRAARIIENAKWTAARKKEKVAIAKAKMEKKVEEVKTMLSILKAAGYSISTAKATARG